MPLHIVERNDLLEQSQWCQTQIQTCLAKFEEKGSEFEEKLAAQLVENHEENDDFECAAEQEMAMEASVKVATYLRDTLLGVFAEQSSPEEFIATYAFIVRHPSDCAVDDDDGGETDVQRDYYALVNHLSKLRKFFNTKTLEKQMKMALALQMVNVPIPERAEISDALNDGDGAVMEIENEESLMDAITSVNQNGICVMVDFYADSCPPCKAIAPKIEQLALATPSLRLYKVNVTHVCCEEDRFKVKEEVVKAERL